MQEHTEHLVRSFITDALRFPPAEIEKMRFSNVNRLPKRVSAVESRNNDRAKLAPPIVVKFSQMKERMVLYDLLHLLESSMQPSRVTCLLHFNNNVKHFWRKQRDCTKPRRKYVGQ